MPGKAGVDQLALLNDSVNAIAYVQATLEGLDVYVGRPKIDHAGDDLIDQSNHMKAVSHDLGVRKVLLHDRPVRFG